MNKVIYVATVPLIPFVQRYLRVQEVQSSGLAVEYWDLSPIYARGECFPGALTPEYVHSIESFTALRERLGRESLRDTVFVLQVAYEWSVLSLFSLMARLGCKTAYFAWVTHRPETSLITKVMSRWRPRTFWRSGLNAIARMVRKVGLVKEFDLVFAAGSLTRSAYEGRSRVVDINYLDYEHFISRRDEGARVVDGEYCVFIDEGCVDNPNIKFFSKLKEMDPEKFYGALRRFFDHLEKSLRLKVVIAAHPGIQYDPKVFGGREVYEGRTCELVKDANLVISQSSTATSFAVFDKKPLMFVYTDEYALVRDANFRTLRFLAHELGVRPCNIDLDKPLDPISFPKPNLSLYNDYKYTSFTSEGTQNKKSAEIIIKALRGL